MASLKRGQVEIELAGESYTLVFNYGTLADIENEFSNKPIDSIYFSGEGISSKAVIQAVRHGMTAKHRSMTAKKVGRLISETVEEDSEAINHITRAVLLGILGGKGASEKIIKQVKDELDGIMEEAEIQEREGEAEVDEEEPNPTPITSLGGATGES